MMAELPAAGGGKSWWAGLADLRKGGSQTLIDASAEGAYCWIAVPAGDAAGAEAGIEAAAAAEQLSVAGIEDLQSIPSLEAARDIDDELAASLQSLEAGEQAAWGELNTYTAEEGA
jgi:hypothetical protein